MGLAFRPGLADAHVKPSFRPASGLDNPGTNLKKAKHGAGLSRYQRSGKIHICSQYCCPSDCAKCRKGCGTVKRQFPPTPPLRTHQKHRTWDWRLAKTSKKTWCPDCRCFCKSIDHAGLEHSSQRKNDCSSLNYISRKGWCNVYSSTASAPLPKSGQVLQTSVDAFSFLTGVCRQHGGKLPWPSRAIPMSR